MAEPAKAPDGGLSREALEKELAGQSPEQLLEMAKRIDKSQQALREMLEDLEAEKVELNDETAQLHETITLFMKEMQKLNIGGMNTVTPQLDEGPLDFVNRFWEQVRPRDTAFQTSENIGEIRKPVPGEESSPKEVLQKQVVQGVQQLKERWGPAAGAWWQNAQGFLNEKKSEIAQTFAAQNEKPERKPKGEKKKRPKEGGGYAGGESAPPMAPEAASSSAAGSSEAAAQEAAAPEPEPKAAPAPAKPEPAEPEPAQDDSFKAGAEEQISSTILIEAQITIDDGSVLVLHVRAADRCKEVAQRFVQEHSLKAWFQEPLTTWLKKVEADAVKFPVKVEADLMDIRKQYSKNK